MFLPPAKKQSKKSSKNATLFIYGYVIVKADRCLDNQLKTYQNRGETSKNIP